MGYLQIDWNIVEQHLIKQSTGTKIAEILGICHHTLYKKCLEDNGIEWKEYKAKWRATGQERLRQKMYDVAMNENNVQMLIFLSKNYLHMSDKVEQKIEVQEWKAVISGMETETDSDIENENEED